jgi:hypothetical protein
MRVTVALPFHAVRRLTVEEENMRSLLKLLAFGALMASPAAVAEDRYLDRRQWEKDRREAIREEQKVRREAGRDYRNAVRERGEYPREGQRARDKDRRERLRERRKAGNEWRKTAASERRWRKVFRR